MKLNDIPVGCGHYDGFSDFDRHGGSSDGRSNEKLNCLGSGMIPRCRHSRRRLGRLRWPSATSRFVGEPLAAHTEQGEIGALHVVNAEPHAVAVPEIEL